ncbi:MAG: hypothetical protein ACH255_12700 [Candidatus Thiodiazotropha sp.]
MNRSSPVSDFFPKPGGIPVSLLRRIEQLADSRMAIDNRDEMAEIDRICYRRPGS